MEALESRHPAAPSDAGPDPAFALSFDASAGPHALRLLQSGTARHAADAALALHELEDLLVALDAWCGRSLDWRWDPRPAARATDAQLALRCGKGFVRLLCNWAWLRALQPPPAALAEGLRWPSVPVVLQADLMRLADDDLAALEPGGAVLLPASMRRPWTGALRGADEAPTLGVTLEFDTPAAAHLRSRLAAPVTAGGGDVLCEVRLDAPTALAGEHLSSWHERTLDLGAFGGGAGLWRCADAAGAARRLAGGRLMPWGDGWALRVETVES